MSESTCWRCGDDDPSYCIRHGHCCDTCHDNDPLERGEWAVIACDDLGVTVDLTGSDPEALADKVASWAQQEVDRWPQEGLIYMLVHHDLIERSKQ